MGLNNNGPDRPLAQWAVGFLGWAIANWMTLNYVLSPHTHTQSIQTINNCIFTYNNPIRAFTFENCISSYFTISKNYFINYIIPFYNTSNIPKLYFFPYYLKFLFYSFFLLFLFFSSFSSLSLSTSSTGHNR